jgi:hypothetical protein
MMKRLLELVEEQLKKDYGADQEFTIAIVFNNDNTGSTGMTTNAPKSIAAAMLLDYAIQYGNMMIQKEIKTDG